jgi:hypothetical protein
MLNLKLVAIFFKFIFITKIITHANAWHSTVDFNFRINFNSNGNIAIINLKKKIHSKNNNRYFEPLMITLFHLNLENDMNDISLFQSTYANNDYFSMLSELKNNFIGHQSSVVYIGAR